MLFQRNALKYYTMCFNKNNNPSQMKAIKILAFFLIGIIVFRLIRINTIYLPCIWKMLIKIQCPGCGLTRAFTLIFELRFIEAFSMNIISIPLFIGGIVTIIAAVLELVARKRAIGYLRFIIKKKGFITLFIGYATISWIYNIIRSI